MKARPIAVVAGVIALTAAAVALGGDDPPSYQPSIVVTVPVERRVQGHGAEWWRRRTVQARKDANARGRTVEVLRGALRRRVTHEGGRGLASAFECIHGFEGAWTDPAPPYFGGVQMDLSFQRSYGGEFLRAWGTADHWPPFVQVAVAMRAYLSGRGFNPWPQTSRRCGLR